MALLQRARRASMFDATIEEFPGTRGTRTGPTAERQPDSRPFGGVEHRFVLPDLESG